MVTGGPSGRTKIRVGRRAAALIIAAVCGVGWSGRAAANGALPQSLGILLPADRPDDIVLATNFGMILSEDGGQSWLWTCEREATSMGYLYSVGPPPRNRIYGLSPEEGLAFSDDGTCSWQRSGGALATAIASDYFVDRSNADRVLAVAASLDQNGDILPQSVYRSDDGGQTFLPAPLYTAPASHNVVGMEIARSNPNIVYLAMFGFPGRHPVLVRSEDGGQSWQARDVEAAMGAFEFRILAVDPDDPNRLYLRVVGLGFERVVMTPDAGATFVTGAEITNGILSGFARMPSGTVLATGLVNVGSGGATNGVGYRSTDRGATFQPWTLTPQPHVLGLAERDGILYLAGKNYSDGWALARSSDEGATVTPFASYEDVRRIRPCVQESCAATCAYEVMAAVWSSEVCSATPPPKPGDPGCGCSAASAGAAREGGGGVGTVLAAAAASLAAVISASLRRRSARQLKRRSVD
jgi:hypothetical protein